MFKLLQKGSLFFIFILFFIHPGFSQSYKVSGKVLDRTDQSTLIGASVMIINAQDSTDRRTTITKSDGSFAIAGLSKRLYKLSVSYMGYNKLNQNLIMSFRNQVVDNILLNPIVQVLNQVTIVGALPPTVLKGDTTEFNASSYKVTADANVEDLVKKMPSVTIEDGVVKAQGEEIKKVLVDGKAFFGDDASVALKNLPAEIVEKVQVFDQLSEQSQLTGFNDGQTSKTMNIVTRQNKRNGQFGKITASQGNEGLYLLGGNLNKFKGSQRFSVVGTTNNINQQNFATQDFLGAMGGTSSFGSGQSSGGGGGGSRGSSGGGRSGGSLGSSQVGLNTINSIGLNYSNTISSKLSVAGSYFFNSTNSVNHQISNTIYTLSTDSSRLEYTNTNSGTKNLNNRINFRIEYLIDSMNTLILIPSVNFQSNTSNSLNTSSQSTSDLGVISPINASRYTNNTKTTGYNISNRLTYRHKFTKTGRTISADFNTTFNQKEPYNTSISDVENMIKITSVRSNRIKATTNDGYVINTNIAYTEPIGSISLIQVNATNSYTWNKSFKQTSDSILNGYAQNDALSNKYSNKFITNRLGVAYRVKTVKLGASAGVEVQNANLSGDQTYPQISNTDKGFTDILPNAQLNYRLTQQTNLLLNYSTSTNPPSITQLQNISEYNSNLTQVTIGNPDLKPQYQHTINNRLTHVNREKGSNFFILCGGTISQNSIGNASTYLDTITIVRPVNKGTGYNLRSMVNYGFPIKFVKCNLNVSGGYNYTQTPGFVNGKVNTSRTNTVTHSEVLSSNISEYLDFTISVNGNYNIVENTVSTTNSNNYYSQNSSFRFNWIFWKDFTFQNDISNKMYKGIKSSTNDFNTTVVNLGLGKKFMKNNAAEFRISVYDLFNKNKSFSTTVTENSITNLQNKTLSRYVMASFIYTFRIFKFGSAPEQQERHRRRDDFDGPPQGGGNPGGPPPGA